MIQLPPSKSLWKMGRAPRPLIDVLLALHSAFFQEEIKQSALVLNHPISSSTTAVVNTCTGPWNMNGVLHFPASPVAIRRKPNDERQADLARVASIDQLLRAHEILPGRHAMQRDTVRDALLHRDHLDEIANFIQPASCDEPTLMEPSE